MPQMLKETIPSSSAPSAAEVERTLRALKGRRVAVAMSGGVDSAVAAYLMRDAGIDVVGLTLRLHDADPKNPLAPRACCAPDDVLDARRIAEILEIPFYVIDARDRFEADVVKPFVDAYLAGETPNPCVGCNSFVKLGLLARRARAIGCEAVATGHYARIRRTGDQVRLFVGADARKDQSYFLFDTPPAVLSSFVFPLGALSKDEVRSLAIEAGLPVHHKLESQEVCFVGGAGAGAYVAGRPEAAGDRTGAIVNTDGEKLGEHPGVEGFTVGQRRGLGLGTHNRLYVLQIDGPQRRVVVGDEGALQKKAMRVRATSWLVSSPDGAIAANVRIRYRHRGAAATLEPGEGRTATVRFHSAVSAIAPGQAAVFYRGEEVLGGGWISEALP